MNVNTPNFLALVVTILGVCSCAVGELSKIGTEEHIYFKEIVLEDNVVYETSKPWLAIIRNSKTNCFTDTVSNPEEVITVRASDLKKALDYFYGSKGSWNVKRIQKPNYNVVQSVAVSEIQIKYEVAYCYYREIKIFRNDEKMLASFRLIK